LSCALLNNGASYSSSGVFTKTFVAKRLLISQ